MSHKGTKTTKRALYSYGCTHTYVHTYVSMHLADVAPVSVYVDSSSILGTTVPLEYLGRPCLALALQRWFCRVK
jgi:hypothetical protein